MPRRCCHHQAAELFVLHRPKEVLDESMVTMLLKQRGVVVFVGVLRTRKKAALASKNNGCTVYLQRRLDLSDSTPLTRFVCRALRGYRASRGLATLDIMTYSNQQRKKRYLSLAYHEIFSLETPGVLKTTNVIHDISESARRKHQEISRASRALVKASFDWPTGSAQLSAEK